MPAIRHLMKSYRLAKRGDLRDWEKCVRIATMIATKLRVTQQSMGGPQVIARRKLSQQPPSAYDHMDFDDDST